MSKIAVVIRILSTKVVCSSPKAIRIDHAFAEKFTWQQGYGNIMISGHCWTALARMLSGDAFRSDLWRRLANNDVDRDWFNDVTESRHNVFATSASSNRSAPAFHSFFVVVVVVVLYFVFFFFAIKSSNTRRCLLMSCFSGSTRNISDWFSKPCHLYAVSSLAWLTLYQEALTSYSVCIVESINENSRLGLVESIYETSSTGHALLPQLKQK